MTNSMRFNRELVSLDMPMSSSSVVPLSNPSSAKVHKKHSKVSKNYARSTESTIEMGEFYNNNEVVFFLL